MYTPPMFPDDHLTHEPPPPSLSLAPSQPMTTEASRREALLVLCLAVAVCFPLSVCLSVLVFLTHLCLPLRQCLFLSVCFHSVVFHLPLLFPVLVLPFPF